MPYTDKQRQKDYCKKHYDDNKAVYIARAKRHRDKARDVIRQFLFDYFANNACVDCGENNPMVLQFDHRVPSLKIFMISNAVRLGYSLARIKKEINSCDVRCANCHQLKTKYKLPWYKKAYDNYRRVAQR
jgi:hypothetical protein